MSGLDLGHDHVLRFNRWAPDRELDQPAKFDGLPDVEKYGANIDHRKPDGSACSSGIVFDGQVARKLTPEAARWTVESWEPLTVSPSLLCRICGDHGFIRDGRWEPA